MDSAPYVDSDALLQLAVQAGRAIMEIYQQPVAFETKADNTPVTQADLRAHEIIHAGLKQLSPDVPQLSEEAAGISWEERRSWQHYWLIDPLDGTKEFIKRNDEFSVNIALISQHKVAQSVVHAPATGESYLARRGEGAWIIDSKGQRSSLRVKPVESGQSWRIACSRSHHRNPERLHELLESIDYKLIPTGSSLKFCRIASGQLDCYPRLGPTSEWDTAAAQGILEQSGGQITLLNGDTLLYNTKAPLLNPEFVAWGATRPVFLK